jgi:hypothetical protein
MPTSGNNGQRAHLSVVQPTPSAPTPADYSTPESPPTSVAIPTNIPLETTVIIRGAASKPKESKRVYRLTEGGIKIPMPKSQFIQFLITLAVTIALTMTGTIVALNSVVIPLITAKNDAQYQELNKSVENIDTKNQSRYDVLAAKIDAINQRLADQKDYIDARTERMSSGH